MGRILALGVDHKLSYCSCSIKERNEGQCNHIDHQGENESVYDFVKRVKARSMLRDNTVPLPQTVCVNIRKLSKIS